MSNNNIEKIKYDKLIFAKTLKEIKKNHKLTQKDLALLLNYSQSYIKDLEKGARLPSIELIRRIIININLTKDEKEMINIAYFTLHPNIPLDLVSYIEENNLLNTLSEFKRVDPTGTNLKRLVLEIKNTKK